MDLVGPIVATTSLSKYTGEQAIEASTGQNLNDDVTAKPIRRRDDQPITGVVDWIDELDGGMPTDHRLGECSTTWMMPALIPALTAPQPRGREPHPRGQR
jgi:hypothetical protein